MGVGQKWSSWTRCESVEVVGGVGRGLWYVLRSWGEVQLRTSAEIRESWPVRAC
jgi:hypothetical protein